MPGPTRRGRTVFAVACLAVLLLVGSALGVVAAMVRAHRAAQSAADLGALAAASAIGARSRPLRVGSRHRRGQRRPARRPARSGRPGAAGTVEVTGPRWLGQTGDLTAEARAGPG